MAPLVGEPNDPLEQPRGRPDDVLSGLDEGDLSRVLGQLLQLLVHVHHDGAVYPGCKFNRLYT